MLNDVMSSTTNILQQTLDIALESRYHGIMDTVIFLYDRGWLSLPEIPQTNDLAFNRRRDLIQLCEELGVTDAEAHLSRGGHIYS